MEQMEVWFVTGSENLYSAAAVLAQVAEKARSVADSLARGSSVPITIIFNSAATTRASS